MTTFSPTQEESMLINAIVARASLFYTNNGFTFNDSKLKEAITLAHMEDGPLDLAALLDADDFNFCHDVFGIDRNIDRQTGKLDNFFLPRFAV